MANEIKVSGSLSVVKGSLRDGMAVRDLLITMSGTQAIHNVQNIGLAFEALTMGDAAAGGLLFARNLGPTNFVSLGIGGVGFAKLLVNQFAVFPTHPSATVQAVADTAAIDLEILYIEP